jgi:hypothetical protein
MTAFYCLFIWVSQELSFSFNLCSASSAELPPGSLSFVLGPLCPLRYCFREDKVSICLDVVVRVTLVTVTLCTYLPYHLICSVMFALRYSKDK